MTARPRLACPEHYEYLRDATIHLLRIREQGYPAAVTAGRISAAEAAAKLELSRCLVAQWRWATDPAEPPLPDLPAYGSDQKGFFGAWSWELADELASSFATLRARARAKTAHPDAIELADLCEALLWFQQGDRRWSHTCRLTNDLRLIRADRAARKAQYPEMGMAA